MRHGWLIFLLVASLWPCFGCRQSEEASELDLSLHDSTADTGQPTKPIAESADTAVLAVVAAFRNNQLGVVWEALPQSYQQDINALARAYAESMDAEL